MSTLAASRLSRPLRLGAVTSGQPWIAEAVHYEIVALAFGTPLEGNPAFEHGPAFEDVHVHEERRFIAGYLGVEVGASGLTITSHGRPAAEVFLSVDTEAIRVQPASAAPRVVADGFVAFDADGLGWVAGSGTILRVDQECLIVSGDLPYLYVVHGPSAEKVRERTRLLRSLILTLGTSSSSPDRGVE